MTIILSKFHRGTQQVASTTETMRSYACFATLGAVYAFYEIKYLDINGAWFGI